MQFKEEQIHEEVANQYIESLVMTATNEQANRARAAQSGTAQ